MADHGASLYPVSPPEDARRRTGYAVFVVRASSGDLGVQVQRTVHYDHSTVIPPAPMPPSRWDADLTPHLAVRIL
jgi:hypothetical protein